MATIISGKELSAKLKAALAEEVKTFPARYGRVPHLVVILVGEDPGSVSYVTGKAKACEAVGIRNTTLRRSVDITEEELLSLIRELNADPEVDGILVQLPLPKHISEAKVIETISREKDVDGFHPLNVAALWQKQPCVLPCTPKGIIKMLKEAGVEIAGKRAVVIGRSNIVGLPVSKLLQRRDSGGGHRPSEVRHRRHGGRRRRRDRRGGQPRPRDRQAVRRRGLCGRGAESIGHHPRSGRCGPHDHHLPDGEHRGVLQGAFLTKARTDANRSGEPRPVRFFMRNRRKRRFHPPFVRILHRLVSIGRRTAPGGKRRRPPCRT